MLDRPDTKAAWLARAAALKPEGRAFIDGAYIAAASGETFARVSPVDGRAFAEIASGDAADIDRAVAAARRSFEAGVWRDADAAHKKKTLLRFAELIRDHTDALALDAHPVRACLSAVGLGAHFAGKLDRAAEQQQLLGQRGLAGVGVRDDGERAPAGDGVLHVKL